MFSPMRQAAQVFKALSEPIRLRILLLLSHGELCVCDLVAVLGTAQSTVSRHLLVLRTAGLITARRKGKWTYYRLAQPLSGLERGVVDATCRELATLPQSVSDRDSLGRHLEEKSEEHCG